MAQWEEISIGTGTKCTLIGTFGVKSCKSTIKLPDMRGNHFAWFLSSRDGIVALKFGREYRRVYRGVVALPTFVHTFFKEDQCIFYRDEKAIYFCAYAKGQEFLEAFLRREKIIA